MKNLIFILSCLLILICGELRADKIILQRETFVAWRYTVDRGRNFNKISFSADNLIKDMEGNKEAQAEVRGFKSDNLISAITGIPGGALCGWCLGVVTFRDKWEDYHTTMLAIGIPLGVISLIFEAKAKRHIEQGVRIYNNSEQALSLKPNFQFSSINNKSSFGLSLVVNFK